MSGDGKRVGLTTALVVSAPGHHVSKTLGERVRREPLPTGWHACMLTAVCYQNDFLEISV